MRLLHAKNKLLSVSLSVCLSAFMTTCVTVVVCLCVAGLSQVNPLLL